MSLTPEQIAAIEVTRGRLRKVHRGATVAALSGWTTAVFAGFTLIGGLFSLPVLVLGIALSGVAWFELRGAKRLKRLETGAPRHLALNQGALASIIVLWCAFRVTSSLAGPGAYASQVDPASPLADAVAPIDDLVTTLTVVVYVVVALSVIPMQGGMIAYYLTRSFSIRAALEESEPWTIEVMRAAA